MDPTSTRLLGLTSPVLAGDWHSGLVIRVGKVTGFPQTHLSLRGAKGSRRQSAEMLVSARFRENLMNKRSSHSSMPSSSDTCKGRENNGDIQFGCA